SYSHGLRKQAVQETAGRSFDQVVASIDRTTGGHVPKRQVENIAEDVTQFFEEFYQCRTVQVEKTEDPLIMSTDAKGIKMRKEALRPATRKAADKKEGRYVVRLASGEKSNSKRMAQVGTVYGITKEVRRPEDIMRVKDEKVVDLKPRARARNKRVEASVVRDPREVINDLFEEAKRRDPEMKRPWAMLIDGSGSQLESIKAAMKLHNAKHTTLILDFVHVLEYVWKAAYSFYPPGSKESENWVRERGLKILQGKTSSVARGMQQSATKRQLKTDKLKAVKNATITF
ncbi:MAG: ISKra4 family transposase, partial [Nitrososphaera sp.]|nr:ISKra4 family transposase [Nitrososphaera sp.]